MTLEDLLNQYIIIEKHDGKFVKGILVDIIKSESEDDASFTTLLIRENSNKYHNVPIIEIENIGGLD